jgi:hypothetical protein
MKISRIGPIELAIILGIMAMYPLVMDRLTPGTNASSLFSWTAAQIMVMQEMPSSAKYTMLAGWPNSSAHFFR